MRNESYLWGNTYKLKVDPKTLPPEHLYLEVKTQAEKDGPWVVGQLVFLYDYLGDHKILGRMFMNYSDGNWQEVPADLGESISKLQYLSAPKVKERLYTELLQLTHMALAEYLKPPVASEQQKAISHSRQLRTLNAAVHLRRRIKGLGLKGVL